MSHHIVKFNSVAEYLTPGGRGAPVSIAYDDWDTAQKDRDFFRKTFPEYYFNIVHHTRCSVVQQQREK